MSFLLGIIYLSFISLGLPDALLGSAWPNMYPEFQVPVSYAGMISMIIAFGTILSSLQSDRLTKRFGTGKVTAASVGITALALWGFSVSHSFLQLCLWAIPYGLGAVLTGGAAWNKGYRLRKGDCCRRVAFHASCRRGTGLVCPAPDRRKYSKKACS